MVSMVLVGQELKMNSEIDLGSSSDDRGVHYSSGAWTRLTFPKIKEEIESDSYSSEDDLETDNNSISGTSIHIYFPKVKEEIKDESKVFVIQKPLQDNVGRFTPESEIRRGNGYTCAEPLNCIQSILKSELLLENNNSEITKEYNRIQSGINSTISRTTSDQQSINKTSLYRNIKDIRRTHSCDICGKCFLSHNNLVKHSLVHSVEKPHKCDVCATRFKRKSDLTRHLKNRSLYKHNHSEERPFICGTCRKAFSRNANLTRHMLIHTHSLINPVS